MALSSRLDWRFLAACASLIAGLGAALATVKTVPKLQDEVRGNSQEIAVLNSEYKGIKESMARVERKTEDILAILLKLKL